MRQQQKQNETHHTERQVVLSDLNAKIDGLDVAIASLMAEQQTLKKVRAYILSTYDKATDASNHTTTPANSASKSFKGPTYPRHSLTMKKARSSLRQEVLIRNAMEREKSSSPPGSVGLLSSDEFEASFPNHEVPSGHDNSNADGCGGDIDARRDVRPSVEGISSSTAENHSAPFSITTAKEATRSTTPSPDSEMTTLDPPARNGKGVHWHAKRVIKRKLQANAAKARVARMRKLEQMNMAAA
ncbi:hypothetical protein J4E85_003717 [Alternaria conjuncta]|uniref:uncharacterized protein n=1 Tax=Alternaria conjuncta TaxID=181017 RepID=UPI00222085E0|nr:uncharacterized protein J4E85_003717 [Alternaria conjuncta]KAI4931128.1 hypothetical protein J4E85_003717 [Alternaria conjuncta]